VYTFDDLEYAFNLAKSSVDKKLDFIQNQVGNAVLFSSPISGVGFSGGMLMVDCGPRYHEFNAGSARGI